jgi:aminoglycoside phosphotransferase (APT) family kinase protein
VAALLAAFGLGREGTLSDGPVASGKLGSIWRLTTDCGDWAVKEGDREMRVGELEEIEDGARFQEAAADVGVPVPSVVRTIGGDLFADVGETRVRVNRWVDLEPPDIRLDPAAVGQLVARLHRVPFAGLIRLDPWYASPVGERRWRSQLAALRAARAPFADHLEALLPDMLAVESLIDDAPRALRTCHRDLWADNVRRTGDGSLCVFDFDNAGLADPSRELAAVLVEYAGDDPARARRLRAAYADAGGPGRVEAPRDFSMVIAQLHHIADEACRRWLASTTNEARADNEAWALEYLDRPVTRELIMGLLDG